MSLVCSIVPSLVDSAAMVTIIAMFSVQYMLRQSSMVAMVTGCVLCEVRTEAIKLVCHGYQVCSL